MLIRILIDLVGCDEYKLKASSALWQLMSDILKQEKWEELMPIQSGTWVEDEEQRVFHSMLHFGYMHMTTMPERGAVCVDICRPEPFDLARILARLEKVFHPSSVRVTRVPDQVKETVDAD